MLERLNAHALFAYSLQEARVQNEFWYLADLERLRLHLDIHLNSSYLVILGAGLMVFLRQVRHGQMDLRYSWDR